MHKREEVIAAMTTLRLDHDEDFLWFLEELRKLNVCAIYSRKTYDAIKNILESEEHSAQVLNGLYSLYVLLCSNTGKEPDALWAELMECDLVYEMMHPVSWGAKFHNAVPRDVPDEVTRPLYRLITMIACYKIYFMAPRAH